MVMSFCGALKLVISVRADNYRKRSSNNHAFASFILLQPLKLNN